VYLVWKICRLTSEESGRLFGMTYSAISHILSSMQTRLTTCPCIIRGKELAVSSLNHCGLTGPHPSHRRRLNGILFMSANHTRLLSSRSGMFRQEPLGSPMLAWLLRCRCLTRYCLRPQEDEVALVFNAPPILPAPNKKGSAPSKISRFSGLRARFRARTLYLVRLATLLSLCESCFRALD
jgi:hypothetical protein